MLNHGSQQWDGSDVLDIATADLGAARGPMVAALRSAGVGSPQRLASELEVEYRRYLVIARRAGGRPVISAGLRAYASVARAQGLVEPDSGPEMSVGETAEWYDTLIPFGNRELFLGLGVGPSAPTAPGTYREAVDPESVTEWRLDALPSADLALLNRDAADARPTLRLIDRQDTEVDHEGQLFSPRHMRFAESEDTAWRYFSSPDYLAAVFRLAGEPLYLVRTSYLVYQDGDFLGIHTDGPTCKYVTLVSLAGEVAPLQTYASLRSADAGTLTDVARATGGFPEADDALPITSEPLLMRGAHLPHARAPHRGQPILLASACFDSLVGPVRS